MLLVGNILLIESMLLMGNKLLIKGIVLIKSMLLRRIASRKYTVNERYAVEICCW